MSEIDRDCPVCRSSEHDDVLTLPQLPVLINARVRPVEAPSVTRADIDLVVCLDCGHMFNRSFDPHLLEYDAAYENTLHYSPHFQRFARTLAERLVTSHRLAGARVAEMGSGPGHFLSLLCDAGVAEAFGYDPSHDPDRLGAPGHRAVTISDESFPTDGSLAVRLAFSQHVLEHLSDPVEALSAQRRAVVAAEGAVYTEVPNGALMTEQCALWDLVYEHVSYFVPSSLELACRLAGLRVTTMDTAFSDQFLWCDARPETRNGHDGSVDHTADPADVAAAVQRAKTFGDAAHERIEGACRDLAAWATDGPVVVWGAGSKGMTFLNLTSHVAPVAAVVDINPRKKGWGVPGTSLEISAPAEVRAVRPRTVLVANPTYVNEVCDQLVALGVRSDVRPIWG